MANIVALKDNNEQNDTEEARLQEEYEQLVIKLHKQQLILSVMKNINCNEVKGVDEDGKKNIDQALDFVRAYDYLKMDNAGNNVLGECVKILSKKGQTFYKFIVGIPDQPRELSYVEKRALKTTILEELPKHYEKELEFCRKLEPEVFEPQILDRQLLDLKSREKDLLTELAAKKVELCKALEECTEIRFGPNQKNDSELTKAKFEVEQVKAQ